MDRITVRSHSLFSVLHGVPRHWPRCLYPIPMGRPQTTHGSRLRWSHCRHHIPHTVSIDRKRRAWTFGARIFKGRIQPQPHPAQNSQRRKSEARPQAQSGRQPGPPRSPTKDKGLVIPKFPKIQWAGPSHSVWCWVARVVRVGGGLLAGFPSLLLGQGPPCWREYSINHPWQSMDP